QFKLFKTEAGLLIALAAPILAAQLAQQSLAFIDTVMAGRVGATDLAGVAVGGSIWGPLFLFLYGVLLAITPMVSQLHGAGKTAETGPLVRRGMIVILPLVVIAVLLLRSAGLIFVWMAVDPQIATIAAAYLKAISWGIPAIAIFFLLRNLSEGLGLTRPSMVIGLASIPVNFVANYVFIYGKFGFPAMGGVGCGWASALSLWFMCGCMLLTIWRVRRYSMTHFFDFAKKCGADDGTQVLRIGLPIGLALLVEASIFAVIALFLSPLGALTVASHQITLNYSSMIFMIPLSISSAITIRVGYAIGKQRPDRARLTHKVGIKLTSAIAVVTATLTLIFARHIAAIYTNDHQVIAIAISLLYLNAFYQISDAIQVGAAGALRGYKDTRVPLLMVVIAYWVIGMPLGYSLALTDFWGIQLGAKGFWISLIIGLSVAAILLGIRLHKVSRTNKLAIRS
ncbi:MAG: MATE family efflux transporter, partial [Desulfuromonadales bacterium]|nr:MATE family efflux transporter [Desulfuromonadales bacterium]